MLLGLSKIIKDDANQAQIIQGWQVPTFNSEDYIPLMVFNTILGSMGLSSRLFRELREKKVSFRMHLICAFWRK